MASYMMAEMGLTSIKAVASFGISREEARTQKILARHAKTMATLSAAQARFQVQRNEIGMVRQDMLARAGDAIVAMQDQAQAQVAAAASGASGNSVDSTMHAFGRAEARQKFARQRQLEAGFSQTADERRDIAVQEAMAVTQPVIAKPSGASMLLGLGTSLLDIYDNHNPQNSNNVRR